jgi:polysaccharide export outer membrane protein
MSSMPLPPIALRSGLDGRVRHASVVGTPYRLDSGDRLRVTVFGQKNLSRIYRVDAGGFISMPLIGAVEARGISTFQLEERIATSLKRKYVKDPKVTVEVETSRPFFILGEVRNGGQYPYVADMTVQMAVAIAGGFTPRAKKRSVQLTRRVNGATVTQNVPASWKVQPGDTISVKERFF